MSARKGLQLWLRSAALALGFVASLGQISSAMHMLLVPHTVCAEHGALVHVALDTAHAHDVASGAKQYRAADSGVDDDEHCLSNALRGATHLVGRANSVTMPLDARSPVVAHSDRDLIAPTVALLALAPKSSPPFAHA